MESWMSRQVCVCSVQGYCFCKNVGSSLYEQIYFSIDPFLCSTQTGVLYYCYYWRRISVQLKTEGRFQNKCFQLYIHVTHRTSFWLKSIHMAAQATWKLGDWCTVMLTIVTAHEAPSMDIDFCQSQCTPHFCGNYILLHISWLI